MQLAPDLVIPPAPVPTPPPPGDEGLPDDARAASAFRCAISSYVRHCRTAGGALPFASRMRCQMYPAAASAPVRLGEAEPPPPPCGLRAWGWGPTPYGEECRTAPCGDDVAAAAAAASSPPQASLWPASPAAWPPGAAPKGLA